MRGKNLISVTEPVDLSSPIGRAMAQITWSIASVNEPATSISPGPGT
ncbi:hypothetical protein [Streptomyces sp. NBC_01136]